MATDRSEYLRGWYQKNRERVNEKRRERTRRKNEQARVMVEEIVRNKPKRVRWWEEG